MFRIFFRNTNNLILDSIVESIPASLLSLTLLQNIQVNSVVCHIWFNEKEPHVRYIPTFRAITVFSSEATASDLAAELGRDGVGRD